MVVIKRVRRGNKYYIYAFDERTGRILTYAKWSSNKEKREKAYKKVKEKVEKERREKRALGVQAFYSSVGQKNKWYKGITTKFEFVAFLTFDYELLEWRTDYNGSLLQLFAEGLHETIMEFWENLGFSVTAPLRDTDFYEYRDTKVFKVDNETLDEEETQYYINFEYVDNMIVLKDTNYPRDALDLIKRFLIDFATKHKVKIRAFGRWYG